MMMDLLEPVIPLLEIGFIAVILNYLLSFFWNTRSMDLLVGLLAFSVVFAISSVLGFPILYTIMSKIASVAALGLIIIFQPELRMALSKLSLKEKRYREVTEFDKFLDQLTNSVYKLADKRTGALIVLEHLDKLDEFSQKGVILNAKFSSELVETIFSHAAPLHDGAIIIRDMTIVAAAVILPLADESIEVIRSMGTRHRAALGVSQLTDAVVIAVSEETGRVSMTREGVISHHVKPKQLIGILHSLYTASEEKIKSKKFSLKKWMSV
jgi:uncharacterized protein (TIGR00159 family)